MLDSTRNQSMRLLPEGLAIPRSVKCSGCVNRKPEGGRHSLVYPGNRQIATAFLLSLDDHDEIFCIQSSNLEQ